MPNSRARIGLPRAAGGALAQLPGLVGGEGGFAVGVDAALFGGGDALALAFEDEGAFGYLDRPQRPPCGAGGCLIECVPVRGGRHAGGQGEGRRDRPPGRACR